MLHNCHSDEKCPPCTHLTQKWCMGNHEVNLARHFNVFRPALRLTDRRPSLQQRSNIPCHLQDISCGLTCNKTLPCGDHRCRRICHRGDCVGDGCRQPCVKLRPDCGHPCSAPCHWGSSCPRTSCTAKVEETRKLLQSTLFLTFYFGFVSYKVARKDLRQEHIYGKNGKG